MITRLRSSFVPVSLLSFALAQSPPQANLDRIDRPWPATLGSGDFTDVAVGRFVPEHPGVAVLLVRGGVVYFCFQPALFEHAEPTGLTGVTAIATVKGFGGAPDRLVAATSQGLRCLEYDGSNGFVDAQQQSALAAFAGDDDIGTLPFTSAEGEVMVLGYKASAVHVATIDAAGFMTNTLSVPAPPSTVAFHATLVADATGAPTNVAVLTNNGFLLLDLEGDLVGSHLASTSAGRLCSLLGAVTMVAKNGANWNIATWNVATGQLTGGGTLSLPGTASVTGLAKCEVNDDDYADLVVSTNEEVPAARVVLGSGNGPQITVQNPPIHILDNDPAPQPPVANLVPLVVHDVDHDRADDFIQLRNMKLSIMVNARSQVQWHVFNVEDDGGALAPLKFKDPLGFETEAAALALLFPDHPGKHGLGLRLQLPVGWEYGDWVRAVVYSIPDANGPSMVDPHHYSFPLSELLVLENPGQAVVDLMIPVRDHTPSGVGEAPVWGGQRYLVELSLQKSLEEETAPIAMEFGNRLGFDQEYGTFLGTFSAGYPWIFHVIHLGFVIEKWLAGLMDPNGTDDLPPNGNEFIGIIVLVESIRTRDLPRQDAPESVGNAVVHDP